MCYKQHQQKMQYDGIMSNAPRENIKNILQFLDNISTLSLYTQEKKFSNSYTEGLAFLWFTSISLFNLLGLFNSKSILEEKQ